MWILKKKQNPYLYIYSTILPKPFKKMQSFQPIGFPCKTIYTTSDGQLQGTKYAIKLHQKTKFHNVHSD